MSEPKDTVVVMVENSPATKQARMTSGTRTS